MGGVGVYCGRVAPTDLLTAARWGLPDNPQQPRRVLKKGKGVWRTEWSEEGEGVVSIIHLKVYHLLCSDLSFTESLICAALQ